MSTKNLINSAIYERNKNNIIKQYDMVMGDMNEDLLKIIFKDNFNVELNKTTYRHPMDFENKEMSMYIEVKSRNINHNKYPTTMVGVNKFEFAHNCGRDVYFIFMFNDGNFYYKYNKNDTFEIECGGRNDRGMNEYNDYVYIPIEKLTKLN